MIPVEPETAEGEAAALKSDRLDDFLFHAANYIYVRRKLFISLAVALVAIIVAVWGTISYIDYRDNLRNEQLYQVEQVIFSDQLDESEKINKAIPMLDEFLAKYEGTEQAKLALFYRAGLKVKQEDYPAAEQDLNQLLTMLEPESDLFFLASLNLSNVLRDQQKIDEAFQLLQSVKTETLNDIVLMEQAELYMNSNQEEKAKELLQILIKDYPNSFYANKARQLLEIL